MNDQQADRLAEAMAEAMAEADGYDLRPSHYRALADVALDWLATEQSDRAAVELRAAAEDVESSHPFDVPSYLHARADALRDPTP